MFYTPNMNMNNIRLHLFHVGALFVAQIDLLAKAIKSIYRFTMFILQTKSETENNDWDPGSQRALSRILKLSHWLAVSHILKAP
jgi:hypothetical protein